MHIPPSTSPCRGPGQPVPAGASRPPGAPPHQDGSPRATAAGRQPTADGGFDVTSGRGHPPHSRHEPSIAVLVERLVAAPAPGPVLVVVAPEGSSSEPTVTLTPISGAGLVNDLAGFLAPPEWAALGCVAPIEEDGEQGRAVAFLVDRAAGVTAATMIGERPRPIAGPIEGLAVDTCRRALGLATPPPGFLPARWFTATWLDRVLDQLAEGRGATWAHLRGAHPLSSLADRLGIDLVALARADVARVPFDQLRALAASGTPIGRISPDVAAWMDEGIFARWLASLLPELEELEAAVEELAPRHQWRRVRAVLGAWAPLTGSSREE